jgi:hypothetical protein
MYNTCMNDRYQDPNWGKHGNPNRNEWFQTSRGLNELNSKYWEVKHKDRPLFHDGMETRVSVWTIVWVVAFIIILSGFSDTARGVIFYGINITETWYASIDSMLDALGAPKLP